MSHPGTGSVTDEQVMNDLGSASDPALVVLIGRWHQEALAEVYRRHGSAVYGLARRVVGSNTLAEEVTQDVFVDLWRRPERFDPERGALRTFLLTRAHGRAVDIIRSEAARSAREEKSVRETVASGYDLDRYAWDLAVADRVKIAVESLPGEERRAIEMAYFDGRTYREVAAMLGEPEGTIKSRIRSGLRRLRESLSAQGAETP
ncbi:MAG: sigma-70 family RNA polymerase sigma factor [Acidimicrobiales bacterium]